ncbi:MAG: hypothetical protein GYB66_00240 [Chloroflexi bacterium]|nr:hypothetical protein [Chloroflexota bacterium]
MAAIKTVGRPRTQWGSRSRILAGLQALQTLSGLAGQFFLLARWSPHPHTDFFLVVSSVPWFITSGLLLSGLEMALPAFYHQAHQQGNKTRDGFVSGITIIVTLLSILGGLLSMAIVSIWAAWSGLSLALSLWLGLALGAQIIPAALGGLWRGILMAEDQLVQIRLALLGGSTLTTAGYALLPGSPGTVLPLVTLVAATLVAFQCAVFAHNLKIWPSSATVSQPSTNIKPLFGALATLSLAAGVNHLQILVERAAMVQFGTGQVTAFAVASRGWEALLAIIVAAAVLPVYPQWSTGTDDHSGPLLRWSHVRATGYGLVAGMIVGTLAAGVLRGDLLDWKSGKETLSMTIVLLPRFVLLVSLQPLVLMHYAEGKPAWPLLGAATGLLLTALGALFLIPHLGHIGVALTTSVSVLPGWVILAWRIRKRFP